MRVIAGVARGHKLFAPDGMDVIRPTGDRVKEDLFNILGPDVSGCRFLDLFAGSGAIGIEALSRGAAEVVFVDVSPKSLELVRKNLDKTRLLGSVIKSDAKEFLATAGAFDIIFMDPPYDKNLVKLLAPLALSLMPNALVVAECGPAEREEQSLIDLCFRQKRYSQTTLMFMRANNMESL